MPSGLRKTSGNNFEIYYEQPWGGVASDKDAVDINPNQLVVQQGVVVNDGVLCSFYFGNDGERFQFTPAYANSFLACIFGLNGYVYAIDQFGYIYCLVSFGVIPASTFLPVLNAGVKLVLAGGPYTGGLYGFSVQVANSLAYISVFSVPAVFTYDGNITTGIATSYVAGQFWGVLDDQLLLLNTNQPGENPNIQPNQINWSSPGEFNSWDPSVNRTAGYNQLLAVEDSLTGFFSFASVGIAVSKKGLIELSPTGIAIGPFNFTALWVSKIGQGCIYADTITQYGQVGYLATDSDIYSLSTGGGFTPISGSARSAICASLYAAGGNVSANIGLSWVNDITPHPFYIICCLIPGSPPTLVCWVLDLTSGVWQQSVQSVPNAHIVHVVSSNTYANTANPAPPSALIYNSPFPIINIQTQTVNGSTITTGTNIFGLYVYKSGISIVEVIPAVLNLVFRAEELKLGREPTIRRIVIRAYGIGVLSLMINSTSFGTITLDGTKVAKTYKSPFGIFTGEDPQLKITCPSFNGVIVKIMLSGAYADGDID